MQSFLKTWLAAAAACIWIAGQGATSFPTESSDPTQDWTCAMQSDIAYPGDAIGNLAASQAHDCCSMCAQITRCAAFTWTSDNGGTCRFKATLSAAASTSNTGAVSGLVAGTPARTHIQYRLRANEIPARAVNLGGWLTIESWMNKDADMWKIAGNARVGLLGEYGTMKYLVEQVGRDAATALFEQHRATFFTEQDIAQIAAAGLNLVRVPVGFWILNDDPTFTPTQQGSMYARGSLKYLDRLINNWAVTHNIAVIVSLHAHQGSQNGYDHSAPETIGSVTWSDSQANIDNSLQLATFIAARYRNSPAFLGMNLMNEPRRPTDLAKLTAYYVEAYKRIRATINDCVLVLPPLIDQQGSQALMDLMRAPDYFRVWMEWHPYFKWGYDSASQVELLDVVRQYRERKLDKWSGNPVFLSEWSLGHYEEQWYTDVAFLRAFASAQLEQFQGARAGWAFWSWKNDNETGNASTWSLRYLLQHKIVKL